jgi:hypothetical protein
VLGAGYTWGMEIRSPFYGLDLWLERFWEDTHQRTLTCAADMLQEQLPGGWRARLQERVFVESGAERLRSCPILSRLSEPFRS